MCGTSSVVEFEPIPSELPDVNRSELSSDQKYLFDITKAVSTGNCSVDLANKSPGKLNHSRWVTTANRILRLYVSTSNPTETLKMIVNFILKLYSPMWFIIKKNSKVLNAAINLFETVKRAQMMDESIQQIIKPVIKNNAYFGHPENILLVMLQDKSQFIREMGWRRVKKARSSSTDKKVRKFDIPMINFDAKEYTELINWQDTPVTEPPITKELTDEQVEYYMRSGDKFQFDDYPCHTQAVERVIKLVTDASASVCGSDRRDGFIRARIKSRKELPRFESKVDFKF